jgi:hypothetical protein
VTGPCKLLEKRARDMNLHLRDSGTAIESTDEEESETGRKLSSEQF